MMDKTGLVEVSVSLDKSDVWQYIGYYYRRSILLQIISFVAVVILFSFLVDLLIPDSTISFLTGLDPLIIAFGVLIVLLPFVVYFLMLKAFKKYGLMDERTYVISKDEIKIKTKEKEFRFPVSSLVRIAETKNTFYLWQQKAPQILPKRFMNESDMNFIRDLKP